MKFASDNQDVYNALTPGQIVETHIANLKSDLEERRRALNFMYEQVNNVQAEVSRMENSLKSLTTWLAKENQHEMAKRDSPA